MRRAIPPLLEALGLHTLETRDLASEELVDVGARLRALREARRLSIKALAEASGLAVNTLSLIEHGKSSPSVSTLQQLAVAMRVPITAFFTPEAPRSRVVYHRAGEVPMTPFPHGALADLRGRHRPVQPGAPAADARPRRRQRFGADRPLGSGVRLRPGGAHRLHGGRRGVPDRAGREPALRGHPAPLLAQPRRGPRSRPAGPLPLRGSGQPLRPPQPLAPAVQYFG
jgi:transcriptional regulator with XRE-family HTH domain